MDDNQRTQAAALLPARRALAIAGRVLTVLIALIAILATLFTIVSVATFDKVEGKGLFSYKFSIVRSDSMKSEFAAGDVVVTKADSRMEVKPGDIITFRSIDPANYGEVVTHKVQELTSYEGKDAYVTYGTANESADSYPALKEKVIGQYRFRLPKAGALFDYLKSPAGYFVLLFLPFFLLMLSQGIRFFRLFKQYKERQGPRPQGEETPPASIE